MSFDWIFSTHEVVLVRHVHQTFKRAKDDDLEHNNDRHQRLEVNQVPPWA